MNNERRLELLDEFAKAALVGLGSHERLTWTPGKIAENCYEIAEAMLEMRLDCWHEMEGDDD